MADEVNKFAFEGGDTAESERDKIKARNEAIQKVHDASVEAAQDYEKAREKRDQALADAEASIAEIDGIAVVPTATAALEEKKPSSKKSEG